MSNVSPQMQAALAKTAAIASNKAALLQKNKEAAAMQIKIMQIMLAQKPRSNP